VLFFFVFLSSIHGKDEIIGSLTITEVELTAIVEAFSKREGKVILPNDGLLSSLKSRKAKIIMPNNLRDMEQNPDLWKQIFESILSMYSYALVKKGDIYRLVPSKDTAKMPTPVITDEGYMLNEKSEQIITRVVVLKHVVSDVVRPMFRYIQDVTTPLALPDKKTIIITAPESSIKYFLEMIELFDKPIEQPFIKTYNLERAIPTQVKTHIQAYFTVLRARKKGAVDVAQQAFFLPDDATGRLLISAIEAEHVLAEQFIEFFDADVNITSPQRPIQIIRLKNSDADSIAKKLDQVLKAKRTTNTPTKGAQQEDIPTIVPFEELNALIVSVEEPETFKYVKEVIDLLDVPRAQVYISSTIVEVSNNGSFDFGLSAGAGTAPKDGAKIGFATGVSTSESAGTPTVNLTGTGKEITIDPTNAIAGTGLGLAIPWGGIDFIPFVMKAAESNTDINVLANPSIVCDDNEHAVIEITNVRSYQTPVNSASGVTTTNRGNEEAGLVLDIKPTISSDNFLKLEITQNVDRFLSPPDAVNSNRLKRRASTVVTIPNKTSVVIGGLTEQSITRSSNKVPVLHKIPLLGELFKSRSNSNENQTLYFFITPEIISNFSKLSELSDTLHDRMSAARTDKDNSNPLYKEVRNNQDIYKTDNILDPLKVAFNKKALELWVKKGESQNLAIALIQGRIEGQTQLLPDFTQPYFNSEKLDWRFENPLTMADEALKELHPEVRVNVCLGFHQHLVSTLQDMKSRSYNTFKNKRSSKPSNHVKIELPAPTEE
jgi:general secretion pathway protein D